MRVFKRLFLIQIKLEMTSFYVIFEHIWAKPNQNLRIKTDSFTAGEDATFYVQYVLCSHTVVHTYVQYSISNRKSIDINADIQIIFGTVY